MTTSQASLRTVVVAGVGMTVFGDYERHPLVGGQRSAECLTLFRVFDRHVERALCGADVHQSDQCSAQIEFVHHPVSYTHLTLPTNREV